MSSWHSLGRFGQSLVVLAVLWLVCGPFIAGRFPDPQFVLALPFLLLVLVLGLSGLVAWALRRVRL
jgi:hypothetical protein